LTDNSPESRVGNLLKSRSLKLVAAESCTGGLVSHLLTNIPGSSEYYLGSITSYANEAKERLLGVQHQTLLDHGAVSRETVLEMAQGVRSVLAGSFPIDSLVGVSVSGIAGPGGGTAEKPVGLVWIGLSAAEGQWAWQYHFSGTRLEIKTQSAQAALTRVMDFLRFELSNDLQGSDV
jgi:PncC family amidohydrolase